MTIDPVCGMEIEESEAEAQSEHRGTTYYFCSQSCKTEFDRDPESFADNVEAPSSYA